jgi:Rod binding domain-containing protein
MKIGPLHPTSTFGLDRSSAAEEGKTQEAQGTVKAGPAGATSSIDPEKLRLAREFEQIFIRKMLSSLEKSGHNAGNASPSASGNAYGSMVVSALAEAVSKGGGVGLAEVIARAASQPIAAAPTPNAAAPAATEVVVASAAKATTPASPAILGATRLTAPENVRITVAQPPNAATYARPAPAPILNENHDIQDSFKDPNR